MERSEQQMIRQCLDGNLAAFENLVRTYQDRIYAYACRMVGPQWAEDVCQDVFLRVYRHLHRFRHDCSLATWIYRIATNVCKDQLRSFQRHQKRWIPLDSPAGSREIRNPAHPQPPEDNDPIGSYELQELEAMVQKHLMDMSEKHRTVLILHDLHGLRYEEIAQVTGCAVGTVKSRLYHARRALRSRVAQYLGDEDRERRASDA